MRTLADLATTPACYLRRRPVPGRSSPPPAGFLSLPHFWSFFFASQLFSVFFFFLFLNFFSPLLDLFLAFFASVSFLASWLVHKTPRGCHLPASTSVLGQSGARKGKLDVSGRLPPFPLVTRFAHFVPHWLPRIATRMLLFTSSLTRMRFTCMARERENRVVVIAQ